MSSVVDINSWKEKKKAEPQVTETKKRSSDMTYAAEYVMMEWDKANRAGQLNSYFTETLQLDESRDMNDLTWLSTIEISMGLRFAIFHPGTSPIADNDEGYSVILMVYDKAISTPLMTTEAYARAFAILFYNELKQMGVV